jgi:hypothetical protein
MWSAPRFPTAALKDASRFPSPSNLRMSPVHSLCPTYTWPPASKVMEEGLQL